MNEKLILDLVKSSVNNDKMTYQDFEMIFDVLSLKEQYEVCNILDRAGIELVDEIEDNNKSSNIGKIIDNNALFQDNSDYNDGNFNLSGNVNYSNEILCTLIQQGDLQAKQTLCMKNEKLVAKYASYYNNFYGNKLSFEDLMQEGYIGLLKAANRFDTSRDNAFTTYAVWWVKQNISRAIMDEGFLVRIPVHMMERISKITKLDVVYEMNGLDYEQRMEKISKELEINIEDIEKCLAYRNMYLNCSSLDIPVGEGDNTELIDFIEDRNIDTPDKAFLKKYFSEELDYVLQSLTEREEKVLRLRYGLYDGYYRTLEEVGDLFNVTRERIRQIEAKAFRKLKHPTRNKRIKWCLRYEL